MWRQCTEGVLPALRALSASPPGPRLPPHEQGGPTHQRLRLGAPRSPRRGGRRRAASTPLCSIPVSSVHPSVPCPAHLTRRAGPAEQQRFDWRPVRLACPHTCPSRQPAASFFPGTFRRLAGSAGFLRCRREDPSLRVFSEQHAPSLDPSLFHAPLCRLAAFLCRQRGAEARRPSRPPAAHSLPQSPAVCRLFSLRSVALFCHHTLVNCTIPRPYLHVRRRLFPVAALPPNLLALGKPLFLLTRPQQRMALIAMPAAEQHAPLSHQPTQSHATPRRAPACLPCQCDHPSCSAIRRPAAASPSPLSPVPVRWCCPPAHPTAAVHCWLTLLQTNLQGLNQESRVTGDRCAHCRRLLRRGSRPQVKRVEEGCEVQSFCSCQNWARTRWITVAYSSLGSVVK